MFLPVAMMLLVHSGVSSGLIQGPGKRKVLLTIKDFPPAPNSLVSSPLIRFGPDPERTRLRGSLLVAPKIVTNTVRPSWTFSSSYPRKADRKDDSTNFYNSILKNSVLKKKTTVGEMYRAGPRFRYTDPPDFVKK